MKKFFKFVSFLQQSIMKNELICLVDDLKFNQQILFILQINGFINGFKVLRSNKILVFFKFKKRKNVIKRFFVYKKASKFRFKSRYNYRSFGFSHFVILMSRKGMLTINNYFYLIVLLYLY